MLLLTAAEARALDRATIDGGHATGAVLMERAGRGAAEAAARHLGSPLALRVLVLAGGGNNGGDGFVAAARLRDLGAYVTVAVVAPREKIAGDARAHLERIEAAGVKPEFLADETALASFVLGPDRWDWAFDALLGTGAEGAPRGLVARACGALNTLRQTGTRIVALDLPTGVSADDGAIADPVVRADLTLTFGTLKRGHALWPGRAMCGGIEVVDIGLLPADQAGVKGVWLVGPGDAARMMPARDPRAHKGVTGRVLVIGGARGMTGAAVLAARGAARAGAGYVRVAVPAGCADAAAAQLLEAMPVACGAPGSGSFGASATSQLAEEIARAGVIVAGPGLGRSPATVEIVAELVENARCPLVLDADALWAISPPQADPAARLAAAKAPVLLTPHVGEMARLAGATPAEVEARRIDVARERAVAWGVAVLLKGAPTIIALPDGTALANPSGNAGMASAGMGDVLAGAVGGLIAQGLFAGNAAILGAFAHGVAGDLAAAEIAPAGFLASDVADRLPRAIFRPGARPRA